MAPNAMLQIANPCAFMPAPPRLPVGNQLIIPVAGPAKSWGEGIKAGSRPIGFSGHSMATAQQLLQAFDALLQPERFKDYGPNGLQVEGKDSVQRIVSGVTASRALI